MAVTGYLVIVTSLAVTCNAFTQQSSSFYSSSSSSKQFDIEIPGLSLPEEPLGMCSSALTETTVTDVQLSPRLPPQVVSIAVYQCAEIDQEAVYVCNSYEELEAVCTSPVRVLFLTHRGLQEAAQFPLAASPGAGLVLRAQYSSDFRSNAPPVVATVLEAHASSSMQVKGSNDDKASEIPEVFRDEGWSLTSADPNTPEIGDVSAVQVVNDNDIVIFHRGSRHWEADSFTQSNVFTEANPIKENTILKCDMDTGVCGDGIGKDLFYLPHGLSATYDGYYLATDVGSHMVLKIAQNGSVVYSWGIKGEPAESNDDSKRFCKPADAEVHAQSGLMFVADGYCNSRIAVFDYISGDFIGNIESCKSRAQQKDSTFNIVHDLAIDNVANVLYAADRENDRICAFSLESDNMALPIGIMETKGRLFAVDTDRDGLLYATGLLGRKGFGFVTDEASEYEWMDKDFQMPHDISVHSDKHVFIADVHAKEGVFKFNIEKDITGNDATAENDISNYLKM